MGVRSAYDDLLAVDDVEALLGLLYAASAQVVGFHLVLLVGADALDDRYLVLMKRIPATCFPAATGR